MKTIIIPTDFSKNADRALQYAASLAHSLKARLVVVNAFDLPYSQNVMSTSLLDIMRETSEKGLKEISKRIEKWEIEFTTRSMMGNPIRIVKDLTKYYQNSMVVLGTKGASGIEEVLIGSNAASILHSVDVPVLAIPQKAPVKKVDKIVYASDFKSLKNDTALARLGILACALNAKVDVLHVHAKGETVAEPPREKFEKHLKDCSFNLHIIETENKNLEQAILDFAEKNDADIIALLAKKYGFFEGLFHSSMTSKVAFHTTRPFLALHEQ